MTTKLKVVLQGW